MRCVMSDVRATAFPPPLAVFSGRISGIHCYAARVIMLLLTGYLTG